MRTVKVVAFLFLVFAVAYSLDPPSNVRVHGNSDTSAIVDWSYDNRQQEATDGFIVKVIDENLTGANSDTRLWEEHTVTTDPKARRLEIHDLDSDKPYSFCVVAVKDKQQSACSSPITIAHLATTTPRRIAPKRKQVSRENASRHTEDRDEEESSSFPWWILIPLILLPLLAILGYMLWKKSQNKPTKVVTHRRTSYHGQDTEALHPHEKTHVVHYNDDKQWEEKRLYLQQQRNATLELERKNEELQYEIAKTRRARLEEEAEALKLQHGRFAADNRGKEHNIMISQQPPQHHDKHFVEYK